MKFLIVFPVCPPLGRETKFHTHIKQRLKLQFYICNYIFILRFLDKDSTLKNSDPKGIKHSPNLICS
jgi:hypothetical protein